MEEQRKSSAIGFYLKLVGILMAVAVLYLHINRIASLAGSSYEDPLMNASAVKGIIAGAMLASAIFVTILMSILAGFQKWILKKTPSYLTHTLISAVLVVLFTLSTTPVEGFDVNGNGVYSNFGTSVTFEGTPSKEGDGNSAYYVFKTNRHTETFFAMDMAYKATDDQSKVLAGFVKGFAASGQNATFTNARYFKYQGQSAVEGNFASADAKASFIRCILRNGKIYVMIWFSSENDPAAAKNFFDSLVVGSPYGK